MENYLIKLRGLKKFTCFKFDPHMNTIYTTVKTIMQPLRPIVSSFGKKKYEWMTGMTPYNYYRQHSTLANISSCYTKINDILQNNLNNNETWDYVAGPIKEQIQNYSVLTKKWRCSDGLSFTYAREVPETTCYASECNYYPASGIFPNFAACIVIARWLTRAGGVERCLIHNWHAS